MFPNYTFFFDASFLYLIMKKQNAKEHAIMVNTSRNMTVGKPLKTILLFSFPILIGNVFQQFYNMADTIIVGRFLGEGALGLSVQPGLLLFSFWVLQMGLLKDFRY